MDGPQDRSRHLEPFSGFVPDTRAGIGIERAAHIPEPVANGRMIEHASIKRDFVTVGIGDDAGIIAIGFCQERRPSITGQIKEPHMRPQIANESGGQFRVRHRLRFQTATIPLQITLTAEIDVHHMPSFRYIGVDR